MRRRTPSGAAQDNEEADNEEADRLGPRAAQMDLMTMESQWQWTPHFGFESDGLPSNLDEHIVALSPCQWTPVKSR